MKNIIREEGILKKARKMKEEGKGPMEKTGEQGRAVGGETQIKTKR